MRPLLICLILAAVAAGEAPVTIAERDPAQAVPQLLRLSRELAAAPPGRLAALAAQADPLARRILVQGWRVPGRDQVGMATHTVAAGDTLARIAKRQGTPYELLVRLNPGLDPRRLAVGQRLAVLEARTQPLRLDIHLAQRQLLVWRGSVLAMACTVGVGAGGTPTPTGSTTIAVRAKDPEWRDPVTGKVHPPRSPGNLLGGFWLGFAPGPDERFRSIGCHGWTGEDERVWVGQAGSRGCIRLATTDLQDLYDLVPQGAAVTVR